jgi:hypothetical protein
MPIVHMSPTDTVPTRDGEVAYYSGAGLRAFPMRPRSDQPVIYVPGIATQPFQHKLSAQYLSALTEREVIGVYNLTEGMTADVAQSAIDKFDVKVHPAANEPLNFTGRLNYARECSDYNPTVVGLLEVLVDLLPTTGRPDPVHVVCHSQGCLITNVAVRLAMWVKAQVLGPLHIFALASPVHDWLVEPGKIELWRASYAQDPIAKLAMVDATDYDAVRGYLGNVLPGAGMGDIDATPIVGSPRPHIERADVDPVDSHRIGYTIDDELRVHNPDMNLFMRYFIHEIRADLGLGLLPESELVALQRAMKRSMYPDTGG